MGVLKFTNYMESYFLSIAELEKNLLESERLLGEISAVSRQDTPDISAMARNMQSMEQAIYGMEEELRK